MDFKTIIDCWPTIAALADDIGAQRSTVQKWRDRNSIPAGYWALILEAAAHRRFLISVNDLVRAATNKEAA